MKIRRSLTLILALALAAALLASCSGGDDPKDTAPADTSANTADSDEFSLSWYSNYLDGTGKYEGIRALDYVTLPTYLGVEVPASEHELSDDELMLEIGSSYLASFAGTVQDTDRAVNFGDTVNIDYVGSVDGVEFEGGNTKGAGTDVVAGSTKYVDGFLTQIVGHKPGETIDVHVTFPETYQKAELAGKAALFVTTINYISTPELTDEFVETNFKDSEGWSTVEEMKAGVTKSLTKDKISSYVETYVLDNSTVASLPDELFDHQKTQMIGVYTSQASQYGMTLEDFLAANGIGSVDEFVEKQRAQLEKAALHVLVLQAIAEDAGVTVSESDVRSFISAHFGEVTDESFESYKSSFGMPYLMQVALDEAVCDLLIDNAVLK